MRSSAVQKNVKELVTRFPSLLENYSSNKLVSTFWSHYEGANTIAQVEYCTSNEAITRAFRRLVKKGEIVLPQHVKDRNQQYQEEFRLDYSPV